MRQTLTIGLNSFKELVRQPIFLILLMAASLLIFFLSNTYHFALGQDPKMVKDSGLAILFTVGLFAAVISSASSVSREIRTGTALAVLSKPVGRAQFILGKYLGVAGALATLAFALLIPLLLASRIAFDVYGDPDMRAIGVFYGLFFASFLFSGFSNYFLNRNFVLDAVFCLIGAMLVAFAIINFFDADGEFQTFGTGVDWRLFPAAVLIFFALVLLAGVAIVCSTHLDLAPSLAICMVVFLLGLMSDYLFGRHATGEDGALWAKVAYAISPNWQLFWLADALEEQKSIPLSYILNATLYLISYLGALLALSLLFFQDRELK